MKKTYNISKKEINRRILAYTMLIIFFFTGLMLFSFDYLLEYLNISIYILLTLALILYLSRVILIKYFNSIANMNVELNKKNIKKNNFEYLLKDIEKIRVKKTTKNLIREIKICFNNKSVTYIDNSLDNLEDFFKNLKKYTSKEVVIKTINEPLDFDHFMFYSILGVMISFLSINATKGFVNLSINNINLISYIISIASFILGIYFIIYKPIYKRDEKANKNSDIIWGLVFIVGAISVLISVML